MSNRTLEELPAAMQARITLAADGCWLWTGYVKENGYGKYRPSGPLSYAHRAVFIMLAGPIPQGADLDHLCRVRHCVNPAHLEPVSRSTNLLRGQTGKHYRALTHCKAGHEFTPENTKYNRKLHHSRTLGLVEYTQKSCRACGAIRRQAKRAASP